MTIHSAISVLLCMLSFISVAYAPAGFEPIFNASILTAAITVFSNHYMSVHRQKTIIPILSLDVLFLLGLLAVNFSVPAMIAFGHIDFKFIEWPLNSGVMQAQPFDYDCANLWNKSWAIIAVVSKFPMNSTDIYCTVVSQFWKFGHSH